MLWLSACASNTISSCPPIRVYGPKTQERIVDQMQALRPADSDLQVFLLDSVALRDAVRACYAVTGRPLPAPAGD
jgi:hypothetical protein